MVPEWAARQKEIDLELTGADEENRIKAMKWERKREEKRLKELQERNMQEAEEQEVLCLPCQGQKG